MNPGSHYQEALQTYQENLRSAKEQGNQGAMATALHYIGTLLLHHGDYEGAGKSFEQSLEVCRALGDKVGMRANLRQLAATYCSLGDYNKALEYGNEALTVANTLGDKSGVALVYSELGHIYAGAANYSKALSHYKESLKRTTDIGSRTHSVASLCQMADVCFRQGKYGLAVGYHQTSLSEGAVVADPGSLANIEGNIIKCAAAWCDKGRTKREIKLRQKDKKAGEQAGNKPAAAAALCDVAALHTSAGRMSAARACLRDAARMLEGHEDPQSLAALRREEGRLAHENGDYGEAVRRLDESAGLARAAGPIGLAGLARSLVALGLAHQYMHAFRIALETYARAVAAASECGDSRLESLGNLHQAQLNAALGLYEEALPLAQASLAAAEKLPDRTLTAISTRLLGTIYEGLADYPQAAAAYERAAIAAEGGLSIMDRVFALVTREKPPLKTLLASDLLRVRAAAKAPPQEEAVPGPAAAESSTWVTSLEGANATAESAAVKAPAPPEPVAEPLPEPEAPATPVSEAVPAEATAPPEPVAEPPPVPEEPAAPVSEAVPAEAPAPPEPVAEPPLEPEAPATPVSEAVPAEAPAPPEPVAEPLPEPEVLVTPVSEAVPAEAPAPPEPVAEPPAAPGSDRAEGGEATAPGPSSETPLSAEPGQEDTAVRPPQP